MTTTHSPSVTEYLPSINSFLDDEGDVRPIDDDPAGFDAVGHTPKYSDFYRDDAVSDARYDYDSTNVDGPSVHLGQRAIKLLQAVDMYSSASKLQGLIDSKDRPRIATY